MSADADVAGASAGPAGPARRLVLLRHAKSSWEGERPDRERPLSARGRRDADAVGRWLDGHGPVPDLVLCSPSARTRETWARAVAAGGARLAEAPVRVEEAVYQAWPDTLLGLARALPDPVATALLVGHAPGLPDLAARLHRLSGQGPLGDFSTSAVAVFDVDGSWADLGPGSARLTAFSVPRG